MKTAIWWIRRDLRLHDNQALTAAHETARHILPVFILDPGLLSSPYAAKKRVSFLYAGLVSLDASLRQRGSRLIIRHGDPLNELTHLLVETGSQVIYAEPDYSPYARRRDHQVEKRFPVEWTGSPAIHPPGSVLKSNAEPYTVFTPFSRAWRALPAPQLPANDQVPDSISTPGNIASLPLPDVPPDQNPDFPAGEAEAQRRLRAFICSDDLPINEYATARDRLDLRGTSMLSPYLRFGMLSARFAAAAASEKIHSLSGTEDRNGAETWLNELIWRDFYMHILYHFPQVRRQNFRLRKIAWLNNPEEFAAWCAGCTGFPVVDAAMRQLLESGWMHNRARMIAASFLTKDLLIDWRWGERWFMQNLVDGDPASNNGGWQWTAGTGSDSAPYFRIFNPVSQGKRHDPDGVYTRRWLPELARVPNEAIHEPWRMTSELQNRVGCVIGKDYPAPIIDHTQARQRALQVYGNA